MTDSQNYAVWLLLVFGFATKIDEGYWNVLKDDIDRLKEGKLSVDEVIDVLCYSGDGELVAYIMERLKNYNGKFDIEEKL